MIETPAPRNRAERRRKPKNIVAIPTPPEIAESPEGGTTPPPPPQKHTIVDQIFEIASITAELRKVYGLRAQDAINVIGLTLNYSLQKRNMGLNPLESIIPAEEAPAEEAPNDEG